jgi:hypothetical protein
VPLDQIEILKDESKVRLDNDYYNSELEKLKILFETPITNPANLKAVSEYRLSLQTEIDEIYNNLQDMNIVDLNTEKTQNACYPHQFHYNYSKLCDVVLYGNECPELIDAHSFKQLLIGFIDLSHYSGNVELYVLVNTGLFFYNQNAFLPSSGETPTALMIDSLHNADLYRLGIKDIRYPETKNKENPHEH